MSIRFSKEQIIERMKLENPWWETGKIESYFSEMRRREYFDLFLPIVEERHVKRAVVLMGPRRVGKTVLIFHTIQKLIDSGVSPKHICYVSVENPLYNGISPEEFLHLFMEISGSERNSALYIFFDEIQYLKEWEVHLKTLVDTYHTFKFIASGSAAAALKLKSNESGAGRFTDFVLPPLTFREYLLLTGEEEYAEECFTKFFGKWDDVTEMKNGERLHLNMDKLNVFFIKYINYGGYPEVSLSETIQKDPQRYIRNDIIDKVLLRDLPSLYGIQDIQELNSLFTYIAYHSGNEMSLDEISKNSGVAKNTIKKYLTYLEAAFLIKIIHRVDNNLRKFKRAHYFKVYLINPSLRSALFSPITESDPFIGNMVETAIYSQLQHMGNSPLYYARWSKGEVDIVSFGIFSTPNWATEVKWSDKYPDNPSELKSLFQFCSMNRMKKAYVTTRSISQRTSLNGLEYEFIPSSLYCYSLGKSILWTRTNQNLFPDYGDVI